MLCKLHQSEGRQRSQASRDQHSTKSIGENHMSFRLHLVHFVCNSQQSPWSDMKTEKEIRWHKILRNRMKGHDDHKLTVPKTRD